MEAKESSKLSKLNIIQLTEFESVHIVWKTNGLPLTYSRPGKKKLLFFFFFIIFFFFFFFNLLVYFTPALHYCSCNQDKNFSIDTDSITTGIELCSIPHISEHCPKKQPFLFINTDTWFNLPGYASHFIPKAGQA